MPERGIDISEWQVGMDVERVVRENGLSFVMVRTNYGSNHDDLQFHRHCDGAERGGAIVTPYVYPLASDTRGSIDDAVRIIGGRYDRCIVDWEEGSGGGDHLRAAHERVWEHGLSTPVVYDPTWYWERQGSPNLDWMGQSGRIGGRWKSWYPDYDPGSFDAILRKLASYVWNDSRGGISTRIVQFTSSGRLNGWGGNLDLNYFPGSRSELEALLTGDDAMSPELEQMIREIHSWTGPVTIEIGPPQQQGEHGTAVAPKYAIALNEATANLAAVTFWGSNYGFGPSIMSQLAELRGQDPGDIKDAIRQFTEAANNLFGDMLARLEAAINEDNADQALATVLELRKQLALPTIPGSEVA